MLGVGWRDVEMRRWEGRWKMMRLSSSVAGLTEAGRNSSWSVGWSVGISRTTFERLGLALDSGQQGSNQGRRLGQRELVPKAVIAFLWLLMPELPWYFVRSFQNQANNGLGACLVVRRQSPVRCGTRVLTVLASGFNVGQGAWDEGPVKTCAPPRAMARTLGSVMATSGGGWAGRQAGWWWAGRPISNLLKWILPNTIPHKIAGPLVVSPGSPPMPDSGTVHLPRQQS